MIFSIGNWSVSVFNSVIHFGSDLTSRVFSVFSIQQSQNETQLKESRRILDISSRKITKISSNRKKMIEIIEFLKQNLNEYKYYLQVQEFKGLLDRLSESLNLMPVLRSDIYNLESIYDKLVEMLNTIDYQDSRILFENLKNVGNFDEVYLDEFFNQIANRFFQEKKPNRALSIYELIGDIEIKYTGYKRVYRELLLLNKFEDAITIVNEFENKEERHLLLKEIYIEMAKQGEGYNAKILAINSIQDENLQKFITSAINRIVTSNTDQSEHFLNIPEVENQFNKIQTYDPSKIKDALEEIDTMEDVFFKDILYGISCDALIKIKYLKDAIAVARGIFNTLHREEILSKIAIAYVCMFQYEKAKQIVNEFENEYLKKDLLDFIEKQKIFIP
jgi:hypothetical protein